MIATMVRRALSNAGKLHCSCLLGAGLVLLSVEGYGQPSTSIAAASPFVPGGQDLFLLDFAGTRIGSFPGTIRLLSGTLDVVSKDGQAMLRATDQSEFLITLSQTLPQNFTVELDMIPKDGGPPPDLTIEGTSTINQGSASAHLLMTMDGSFGFVQVIGGALDNVEVPIPDQVRVTLPSNLTKVGLRVAGSVMGLFINGTSILEVQAQFARGRVLRVTLGGSTDEQGAVKPVYLARVRVATGAPAPVSTLLNATTTGTITPMAASPASALLPPRTITLSGFSATGDFSSLTARTVTLAGFTAFGDFGSLPARSISIPGFTATGAFASLAPRTVTIPGYTAVGLFGSLGPRTITIPGFTASGFGSLAPRAITISGFAAVGLFASLTPRTITLPAFTAVGYGSLPPRTVTIAGFTAAGVFTTLPPRTITLPGFTAVRIP